MLSRLALLWFRLTGWRIVGDLPPAPKYVAIGAPHTTNWDFVVMLAVMTAKRVRVSFMGKHTLFRWPFGSLMRRLGGIPIRRDLRENAVEQMAAEFGRAERLVLVIAPEGTRGRSDRWKSGFYHIARTARVPIVPGKIDYPAKVVTLGPTLEPGPDVRSDMDVLRAFFAGAVGKYPDAASEIRLAEEG